MSSSRLEVTFEEFHCVTVLAHQFSEIKEDFISLLNSAHASEKNYSGLGFFRDEHLIYSLIYKNSEPFQLSTVITRPIFKGGYRILNRLYVKQELRQSNLKIKIPKTTLTMAYQQVVLLKQNFQPSFVFISRYFNTHKTIRHLGQSLKKFTGDNWDYKTERYQVVSDGNKPDHFQWICYLPIETDLGLIKLSGHDSK